MYIVARQLRSMSYYVGIDLGATRLRAAIASESGEVLHVARQNTPSSPETGVVEREIQGSINRAATEAGVELSRIAAVGIGSIGPLDFDAGDIINPPNLHESIERLTLADCVREYLDTDRITLLNDSTAGIRGERHYAREEGRRVPDNMVYLTLSTGISAGVAVNGRVLGANVGEVGHWIVDPERSMDCGCGHAGHWEAYCGGRNIPRYARYLHDRYNVRTDLATAATSSLDARTLFANYDRDDLARLTIDKVNEWNAVGVTNLVHAFNPSVISIGGSVALENQELVVERIREHVADETIVAPPEIRTTPFGGDTVVRGAVSAAIDDT
jgi:glucokinase